MSTFKHLAFFIFASVVLLSGCKCKTNQCSDHAVADSTKAVSISMRVEGMTCGNCEKTITAKLKAIDGVFSPVASYADTLVTFKVDTSLVTIDSVRSAIAACGFVPVP